MANKRPEIPPRTTSEAALNSTTNDASTAELTAVVDELLGQLNQKFSTISSELLSKMDDMSRRLDNLEATIQGGDSGKGSGAGK
ncbi:heat shock factor binding protein 1-domain-containing protein [Clohesyomyces aquaticus]|uniref:Heat shock factor binding protein 1-domain-containing protein n=1 Tax=Clohesyomyces aquaticus TaxID=1231657 RepID=A0A1Y2AAN0_9PLEO|nr:heat shock factor binding protein 1-domain-containing protein [Clohesyomyces aquaticus]